MQVFNLFFKIAKTKWLATLVFLGIFLYTIKKRHTQPHYETLHK